MEKKLIVAVLVLAGGGYAEGTPPAGGDGASTLFFFFTPDTPSAPIAAKAAAAFAQSQAGKVRVRPVLLIEDWTRLGALTEECPLYKTLLELRALGGPERKLDIPVYDLEGLRHAQRWKIRHVPALVLVANGRAHLILGPRGDLGSLLGCKP